MVLTLDNHGYQNMRNSFSRNSHVQTHLPDAPDLDEVTTPTSERRTKVLCLDYKRRVLNNETTRSRNPNSIFYLSHEATKKRTLSPARSKSMSCKTKVNKRVKQTVYDSSKDVCQQFPSNYEVTENTELTNRRRTPIYRLPVSKNIPHEVFSEP